MNERFLIASARGSDIDALAASLFAAIDPRSIKAKLGFLYVTEALSASLDQLLEKLRQRFEVQDWVGAVGFGICCTGAEIYDEPAAVIMLTQLQDYQLFSISNAHASNAEASVETKPRVDCPGLGIVHGDATQAEFPQIFQTLCDQMGDTFFVGGLSASNQISPQPDRSGDSLVSGVLIDDSSGVVVSHTQGCTPMKSQHVITKCNKNLIIELDHRPALEVFKSDIGEVQAKDPVKMGGYMFVGFPVQHSDTHDYLVRNIIGIDLDNSVIAVGDYVEQGGSMMFCRRDQNSAIEDMQRMLGDIKSRLSATPKGALYFSCIARGRSQFGDDSAELKIIQEHLGDLPLVGFFANGEILHNRIYAYTGVLTVFT